MDEFVFGKIVEASGCRNDNVRSFAWIFELSFIIFERDTAKIAAISQLGFLEIAT